MGHSAGKRQNSRTVKYQSWGDVELGLYLRHLIYISNIWASARSLIRSPPNCCASFSARMLLKILRSRIRTQSNLQPYPGAIFLPAPLFQHRRPTSPAPGMSLGSSSLAASPTASSAPSGGVAAGRDRELHEESGSSSRRVRRRTSTEAAPASSASRVRSEGDGAGSDGNASEAKVPSSHAPGDDSTSITPADKSNYADSPPKSLSTPLRSSLSPAFGGPASPALSPISPAGGRSEVGSGRMRGAGPRSAARARAVAAAVAAAGTSSPAPKRSSPITSGKNTDQVENVGEEKDVMDEEKRSKKDSSPPSSRQLSSHGGDGRDNRDRSLSSKSSPSTEARKTGAVEGQGRRAVRATRGRPAEETLVAGAKDSEKAGRRGTPQQEEQSLGKRRTRGQQPDEPTKDTKSTTASGNKDASTADAMQGESSESLRREHGKSERQHQQARDGAQNLSSTEVDEIDGASLTQSLEAEGEQAEQVARETSPEQQERKRVRGGLRSTRSKGPSVVQAQDSTAQSVPASTTVPNTNASASGGAARRAGRKVHAEPRRPKATTAKVQSGDQNDSLTTGSSSVASDGAAADGAGNATGSSDPASGQKDQRPTAASLGEEGGTKDKGKSVSSASENGSESMVVLRASRLARRKRAAPAPNAPDSEHARKDSKNAADGDSDDNGLVSSLFAVFALYACSCHWS